LRDFRRRQQALEQKLGRTPTREEVASALALEPSEVDELWRIQASVVSLDAEVSRRDDEAGASWIDVLGDPEAQGAVDAIDRADLLDQVLEQIATLPPRERRILLLHYGLASGVPLNLREIGQELSLSGERVRQLEASALARLRRRLGAGGARA
jgi:RNA polymerase primary sigma factor